jgi:hypothetical protein
MAKKKAKKKSEKAYPISYDTIYCLTLKNTGGGGENSTFGVLYNLVQQEIERIDNGESDESTLTALLIIRSKLEAAYTKGGT